MEREVAGLFNEGEMARRVDAFDWSSTPLGPRETWPDALRHAARLVLLSPHPMAIWWGRDLLQIYNDPYAETIGEHKHPETLARPSRECWPEIWDTVGRGVERVLAGGSVTGQSRLLPVWRNGVREDVW